MFSPPIKGRHLAVLWDVYGTLLAAERGDLDSLVRREKELRAAFELTIREFDLRFSPAELHREWLRTIAAQRAAKRAAGLAHPEICIEDVWHSLAPACPAREVALCFERHANPKRLMPDARETVRAIQERGLRQGLVSNAQFYTLIELAELIGPGFFDPDLTFLSCDLGVAKPDLMAFRRAADELARGGIAPADCVVVGDSTDNDIAPARQLGFDTVLFGLAGDIQHLPQLLERL